MAYNTNLSRFIISSRPIVPTKIPQRLLTVPRKTLGISTRTLGYTPPGGWAGVVKRRPGVSVRSRPQATIRPRPGININGGVPFGVVAASGGMPARSGTAAAPGGGLPALSGGGGFDLGLGAIGGQIGSSVTGIIGQIRNLIPLAIKIIIAVIVVKIVLWLVRGRRR